MAKLTLRDIAGKLKEKLQTGVSNVGNFAKQSAQYLPPVQAYNAVKQIGQSPIVQQGLNYYKNKGGFQGALQRTKQDAYKISPLGYVDYLASDKPTGIKPIDYTANRVGNYIKNTYVASAKDIPQAFNQIKQGGTQQIFGKNVPNRLVGVGRLGLDVLGAVPDPTDIAFAGYNYLKGVGANKQQGIKGFQAFDNAMKAVTQEKPVGLGEALTKNKTAQTIGNIAELPLILAGGFAGRKQALKQAEKFKQIAPEIREAKSLINALDLLKPKDQMMAFDKAQKVLEKIGYKPTPELRRIIGTNPKEFVNYANGLFEDALNTISNPQLMRAGLSTKSLKRDAQAGLSVPSTKGVESMPSVMKTPELPKVDPFEADMIKYNNELSNAAKLPKTKKPFIDTSRQSTEVGDIKSNIGENGGVVDSIKRSFADWVNTRKASQVEGILQGRSFADLKEKGMQGIFEFQSGDKTGRYADVKNYFDTKYGQMQEKGIDFNYKEDYLTQIWDNTSEEISRVFGRSLSKTPSFTLESLIKNYQEGINAGLKPKYNNIPDLIQSYESATNKAIADHNFFRTLIRENMVTTGSKAPRDWVTIDPDRFPRFSVKTNDETYRGIYKAPPELAKMLNNYLGGAKFEWLAKAADWTSSVKNRVLSFGIPGTAINAHGFNILARNVMASKNPIEGAITGIKYMLNPISAQRQLDATLAKAPEAVKYGLTLSANEFTNILQEPQGFRSKFGDVWNKLFERGLFDRMLPALKLQKFTEVFEGYKKGGMNEYEAGKAAAKFTNDVFGGINIDELGKSRDFENMLRVTILAPDWLKTNLNLAGKIPQSFTTKILDPKMSAYRKFATTMLGSYITANIVNKLTSGHWMYQNDPGNSFNIEAGYTEDGQKRYIRPFGTAADFVRLPSDVFTALKKGDVSVIGRLVRNRLSIPLGVGIGMMTDTDYAGQPIGWRGTDKYGNEMPLKQRIAGVGGEVLTLAGMPSFMKQGIDYASGKTGGEQALLQAFELPVRYSGGAFNKSSQFIKGLGQREGAKGKELYDLVKSVKGVTLSKNQKELLTQNGLKSLPDIMQQKKINSMNTQVQKIKEDIVSGSLTQEEGAVKIQDIVNQIPEVSTNKKGADNSLVSTASASDELNKPYVFQYTSPSGKISIESVDLSKDIPEPKLTGNKELDKKLISTYKGELTSRATDIRKLYEAGKIDANQAEKLLGELKIKSGSVGGVKKPKKITLKVSSYKAPKITIKKRSTKLPTIKFKKPKKTKIVRRYTIK